MLVEWPLKKIYLNENGHWGKTVSRFGKKMIPSRRPEGKRYVSRDDRRRRGECSRRHTYALSQLRFGFAPVSHAIVSKSNRYRKRACKRETRCDPHDQQNGGRGREKITETVAIPRFHFWTHTRLFVQFWRLKSFFCLYVNFYTLARVCASVVLKPIPAR
jgi:hypothetical protein